TLFLYIYRLIPYLLSFPTRRSSYLRGSRPVLIDGFCRPRSCRSRFRARTPGCRASATAVRGCGGRPRSAFPPVASASCRGRGRRSEEHTSELQSRENIVCRLLLD